MLHPLQELQEQEKAELLAKLDALYSPDSPSQAAHGPNPAADFSGRASDGLKQAADVSNRAAGVQDQPKSVRSRGQRLVEERADRKLERARAYLDEKQIAALQGLSQERGEDSTRRKGGAEQGEARNKNTGQIPPVADTGHSSVVGSSGGVTEQRTGAEERIRKEAWTSLEVRREGKEATGDGSASQAELAWLRTKVAELERGLKGLEDSLRQKGSEDGRVAPETATDGTRDRGGSTASSRGPDNGEAGPGKATGQQSLAKGHVTGEGQKEATSDVADAIAAKRKASLFDYVWPQWLRSSETRDDDQSRPQTRLASDLKKDESLSPS